MNSGQTGREGARRLNVSDPVSQPMPKTDLTPSPEKPGPITIARHGRPDADRTTMLDWRGYESWWDDCYQPAGLHPDQTPPDDLIAVAAAADIIFASTLRRAIETARAVAPGRELVIDACFIEAELPPPAMAGRFMAKTWGVFARCSWWQGFSRGRESRKDAEIRAALAARTLVEAAQSGPVLLCAHGWFNRMMRPHMRALGWRCVRDGGDSYWSFRRYEYRPR
ncbi:Broad specificity phosphatase PhoE [Maricaulis salignorans]|uniref:Broad specificity phosphatase PhoE n=1 Tax=Maricaulis salignorans TaxID=144026 RepID=A0A1G9MJZ3_9PROT|nr:Broad specificity phosphatase PhoE [Maricaulis salignorans]